MNLAAEQRPDPAELLRKITGDGRRRAILRVYLGYARGCGTTTAMLDEAGRRASRGTDTVVAAYEVHDEPAVALRRLEVVQAGRYDLPMARPLDLDAVLARNPEVACIDDLMGLDTSGRPRIESVPKLLKAGTVVLGTLHLLSVRSAASAVAEVAGFEPREPLLGDDVLELIDEIEYVDITPDDLLQRIRERAILTPAQLAVGMQRELRPAVLSVLRETALRLTAEHMDRQMSAYLPHADSPLEFRGRIVLCLSIDPGHEERIRSVARYAATQGAKLTVVAVRTRKLSDKEKGWLGSYASLTHQLHGEFIRLEGRNVATTLVKFIQDTQATEVVLGHRRRAPWRPWDTTTMVLRPLTGVDVHILRHRDPAPSAN
jgi:two-component system, OmpR family, sensor histidine kinase KdpD